MLLPEQHNLPIDKLSNIFKDTVASYKYYWFISILDSFVIKGKSKINVWDLVSEMVGNAWYPIHYFHISFGKLDSLDQQIRTLHRQVAISIDKNKEEVVRELQNYPDQKLIRKELMVFTKNVPFRFLYPWIKTSDDKLMAQRSMSFENDCLYALSKEGRDWFVTINPLWHDYLSRNYAILKDFAFWNLAHFVQNRNPNMPNVINKLIKPLERGSLTKQRNFWNRALKAQGGMKCIYTDQPLTAGQYDLDHFIPWSFVAHDKIWDLLPADPSINSSKSNKLPDLDLYLGKFAIEQQKAIRTIYRQTQNDPLFGEFAEDIAPVSELVTMEKESLISLYHKVFNIMYQNALYSKFETWNYSPTPQTL